ncbi:MAG: hypothetical protein GX897_08630, partial [Clostridiales bacterium]|nr:hypothetical protein [Clostridiales bacterium]
SRRETALKYFIEQEKEWKIRTESGIELYRKGNGVINIKHRDGSPVGEGVKVKLKQKNHEFRFGANIFMLDEFETDEKNRIYREKFPEFLNLATLPFYWSDLEPEEGKPRFAADSPKIYRRPATDLCVDYCLEKGIEPKCHCLNYDNFVPDWLRHDTSDAYKKKLDRRMREISERYADKIPSFEVTNETLQGFSPIHSKFYYDDDFLDWSYRTAAKYFPLNRLIINDYDIWSPGGYNDRCIYYMQIERLLSHGITHLDSIGLQFHSFFPQESEASIAKQRYNPESLYMMMDNYARLGKNLQITEMTIPAYSKNEEDEEIQAELTCGVYRTFFSHPAMEAVIYWNLVDGYAYNAKPGDVTAGENVFFGGLLRFDMSEKPVYKALKKMINEEWNTETVIDAVNGKCDFRGFYGDYDVLIVKDGSEIPSELSLSKDKKNVFDILI